MPLCLGAAQRAGREKAPLVLRRSSGRSCFVTGSAVCPEEFINILVTRLHILRFAACCTPKPPLQRPPLQRAPETPANKYLYLLKTNGLSFLPKFRPKKEGFKVNVTLVKSQLMFRQL